AAGLAGLHDAADEALVVGDAQLVPFDAKRRAADEDVVRPVPEEDASPIGLNELRGGLGHLREQRNHLVELIPLAGDFENGLEPANAMPLAVPLLNLRDRAADDGSERERGGLYLVPTAARRIDGEQMPV